MHNFNVAQLVHIVVLTGRVVIGVAKKPGVFFKANPASLWSFIGFWVSGFWYF